MSEETFALIGVLSLFICIINFGETSAATDMLVPYLQIASESSHRLAGTLSENCFRNVAADL